MNKKSGVRTGIVVLVLLLAVGFAAVTTQLVINGTINIGANTEDFENNVIFKTATHTGATEINGETAGTAEISADKKSITWTTQVLDNIGETATLTYNVQNNSQYDAALGQLKCSWGTTYDEATAATSLSNEYITVAPANGLNGTTLTKGAITDTTNISANDTILVTQIKSYVGEGNQSTTSYTFTCQMTATAANGQ